MKKSSLLGRTKHDNLPMFVRADNIQKMEKKLLMVVQTL